jgi:hypothetical protein
VLQSSSSQRVLTLLLTLPCNQGSAFAGCQPITTRMDPNPPITAPYSCHVKHFHQSASLSFIIPAAWVVFWWRNFCLSGPSVFSPSNMLGQGSCSLIGRWMSCDQNSAFWLVDELPAGTLALDCGCCMLGCFLYFWNTSRRVLYSRMVWKVPELEADCPISRWKILSQIYYEPESWTLAFYPTCIMYVMWCTRRMIQGEQTIRSTTPVHLANREHIL